MKLIHLLSLSVALLIATSTLGGCCGDALKTPEARQLIIDDFNQNEDNKSKGCTLEGKNSALTKLVHSCEEMKLAEMETHFEAVCASYKAVGFEKVELSSADGKRRCEVDGCSCKDAKKKRNKKSKKR